MCGSRLRRPRGSGAAAARPNGACGGHAKLISDRSLTRKDVKVAGDEPVTSPDQHKPGNRRAGRIAGVTAILVILAMIFGNHQGNIENIWLIAIAALIAALLIGDEILRRNGLRP